MSALTDYLKLESAAILNASLRLDDKEVEKALLILKECSECNAKLIVTGVGKSGIVARKISATFCSIGLMSIYLNPLDALHGDIGVIAENDACIILSNSGETEELLEIIPHLKRKSSKFIGIVGNQNSFIKRICNVFLDATVDREICPLNLAPTASTAVAMAIGDALASVFMKRKGISDKDFAINHPSGLLGKKLTLKVSDLMIPKSSLKAINLNTRLDRIIGIITHNGMGCACVQKDNKDENLLGLITDGDLRRALKSFKPEKWSFLKASEIMTTKPKTVPSDLLAIDALRIMEDNENNISVLPVVTNSMKKTIVIGIIRLHDIVQAGLR